MHWSELAVAIDEFRSVRERTLEMAAGLSQQQAAKRARPNAWSVAEVLDHLVQTELAFRGYLLQALERGRSGETGTIRIGFREVDTRLRPLPASWMPVLAPFLLGLHAVTPFGLRLAVMRTRGVVWAAAPKVAMPGAVRPIEELRANLEVQIRDTTGLFQGELPEELAGVRVAHPLYGANSVPQVFRLMGAHEGRHQDQLRDILGTS